MDENDNLQPPCCFCSTQLSEPYIECIECENINLCTSCFAKGVEIFHHKNDHYYSVRRNDFPLFPNSDWPAKDEYLLLQAIARYGYGNWDDVSKMMQKYTKLQCKEHYDKFYINDKQCAELPTFTTWSVVHSDPPFLYKQDTTCDPPRDIKSHICQNMAGYNPYRSDFEMNYDNHAEQLLNFEEIEEDEDDELMKNLQCSVVLAYNTRLKERQRRYSIMRRHGLIILRKFVSWLQSFEDTLGKQVCDRLVTFMQILSGTQFDMLMESLSKESEMQIQFYKLCEFRRNGIKSSIDRAIYEQLKQTREKHLKETKVFSIKYGEWKQLSSFGSNLSMVMNNDVQGKGIKRRCITPLDILGLPGYEKLTDKEREFCSTTRLPPSSFLEFRETLINENEKQGFLRLCDARKIIKIDVNKTRKLYDLLVSEGLVKKCI